MNYSDYDYEGLWFDTFRKVLNLNQSLNGLGLDKSQLREVSTSVFIAKTQRGIVRPEIPEDEDEVTVPTIPQKQHGNNGNGARSKTDVPPASPKQINLIRSLLNNKLVTTAEQARLQEILSMTHLDRHEAGDLLDYFFGKSEKKDGQWVKTTDGVLEERKARSAILA